MLQWAAGLAVGDQLWNEGEPDEDVNHTEDIDIGNLMMGLAPRPGPGADPPLDRPAPNPHLARGRGRSPSAALHARLAELRARAPDAGRSSRRRGPRDRLLHGAAARLDLRQRCASGSGGCGSGGLTAGE